MQKCFIFILIFILSGCATTNNFEIKLGRLINDRSNIGTCLMQARIYAWLLGGNAKVMSNGKHAFVIKNKKIYDSTQMGYTGLSVKHRAVLEYYGNYWIKEKD